MQRYLATIPKLLFIKGSWIPDKSIFELIDEKPTSIVWSCEPDPDAKICVIVDTMVKFDMTAKELLEFLANNPKVESLVETELEHYSK